MTELLLCDTMAIMQILTNRGGLAATNSYLIADESTGQAVLIDAPNDTTAPLIEQVKQRGWQITQLWLTHAHFDHIADHEVLTQAFPQAKVLAHKLALPRLRGELPPTFPIPLKIPPRSADQLIEDGQLLTLGSLTAQVIYTPGHAPGHVCFYFAQQDVLIGGDLIIGGAHGRTDLPGANYDDLVNSIRRIMKLPPQTQLLPGHGDPSTLAHELQTNPHVAKMVAGHE